MPVVELDGNYWSFIRNFAETSAALHREASKTGKFNGWTETTFAFEEQKEELTSPPVLATPLFYDPSIVKTDASRTSLGGAPTQNMLDNKIYSVPSVSRTTKDTEKNYSTLEMEALPVLFALKKFQVYFLSTTPFSPVIDCQTFWYAFHKKFIHGRPERGLDLQAVYNLTGEYCPRMRNGRAQYLLRISLPGDHRYDVNYKT